MAGRNGAEDGPTCLCICIGSPHNTQYVGSSPRCQLSSLCNLEARNEQPPISLRALFSVLFSRSPKVETMCYKLSCDHQPSRGGAVEQSASSCHICCIRQPLGKRWSWASRWEGCPASEAPDILISMCPCGTERREGGRAIPSRIAILSFAWPSFTVLAMQS